MKQRTNKVTGVAPVSTDPLETVSRKADWISERSARESLEILRELSQTCASLGGPLSRELNKIAQSEDYSLLMSYDMDYEDALQRTDGSITDVIYSRQILAFFQKSQFLDYKKGWNKQVAAASRFVEAERMCRDTNKRLRMSAVDPSLSGPTVAAVLHYAQRKIADVLGDLPCLTELPFSFGPGANTNVKGTHSSPRLKLGATLECSSNMSPTVHEFLAETPEWAALHDLKLKNDAFIVDVGVVPGKVMFVPKNAKTDRSISIEPILNGFFQKGVGSYIRDRLMRFDVDLKDQSRNQVMAAKGSIDGTLATVDLSMASDCVSRELVWNLLPYDWAEFLDKLRTSTVLLPAVLEPGVIAEFDMAATMESDKPYYLEKFSSMGNAFTFELESLLFYGLCYGSVMARFGKVTSAQIGVYGDDLIVPVEAFTTLVEVLSWCGFSLNHEKSFHTGSFRESCGADYLSGFDIRPFYQKTLISDRSLYVMHNWFLRHGEIELARVAESFTHPAIRLYGPDNYGDGHLIGTHSLRYNRLLKRNGWDGGYFDSYALRERRYYKPSPGDAILPSYSVYTRSGKDSPTDPDVVRGSRGYTKISIYTLERSIFSRKD